jgi:Imm-5 like putative immunity protein
VWAADCAERVLGLFEAEAPGDSRPRDAIARLRAFARGELGVGEARRRFVAHAAAREVSAPAAVAAARAAGQAASIPHMGAHALGAAAYAAKAAGLAAADRPEAVSEEICWQLGRMSAATRAALRQLPPVGENSSGPLGPGLLASGLLGTIIRDLQAGLADRDDALGGSRGLCEEQDFAADRLKARGEQCADRGGVPGGGLGEQQFFGSDDSARLG